MSHSKYRDCLLTLCLLVIFILSECRQMKTVYRLNSPEPNPNSTIFSCVFLLEIKKKGHDSIEHLVYRPTMKSGCSSEEEGPFEIIENLNTPTVRVQMVLDTTPISDVYLPIPAQCLGHTYLLSTIRSRRNGGVHFAGVFNSNNIAILVNIDVGQTLSISDINVDGSGSPVTSKEHLQLNEMQMGYITSQKALDGISLESRDVFGVFVGSWSPKNQIDPLPQHVIEMLPPTRFFGKEYFVPEPLSGSLSLLKILSLSTSSSVNINVTSYSAKVRSTTISLSKYGQVYKIRQTRSIAIRADRPIMVVAHTKGDYSDQFHSFTLMPPTTKWTWSAVLYPLTSGRSESGYSTASVIILSQHISGLSVFDILRGQEITQSVGFIRVSSSDYSVAYFNLGKSRVLWLRHERQERFQVIQQRMSHENRILHSFVVTVDFCREDDLDLATSAILDDGNPLKDGGEEESSRSPPMIVVLGAFAVVSIVLAGLIVFLKKVEYGLAKNNEFTKGLSLYTIPEVTSSESDDSSSNELPSEKTKSTSIDRDPHNRIPNKRSTRTERRNCRTTQV